VNYERNKKGARFFETQCMLHLGCILVLAVCYVNLYVSAVISSPTAKRC